MTMQQFIEFLSTAIDECEGDADTPFVDCIETFDEAGLLTNEDGLVVTMADGSEFHLTLQAYNNDDDDE